MAEFPMLNTVVFAGTQTMAKKSEVMALALGQGGYCGFPKTFPSSGN